MPVSVQGRYTIELQTFEIRSQTLEDITMRSNLTYLEFGESQIIHPIVDDGMAINGIIPLKQGPFSEEKHPLLDHHRELRSAMVDLFI